jgi:hypothetical protein
MFCNSGRRLYHHGNHPIKWVRITGVVVAIDDFTQRRVYTVDDSSGMCIECICPAPPKPGTADPTTKPPIVGITKELGKEPKKNAQPLGPSVTNPNISWDEVDVGSVVKIKGGISTFRDQKQIEIIKVEVLKSTDQEVRCWNEVLQFRREVLEVPWTVSKKQEEKCRGRALGERSHNRKKSKVKEGHQGYGVRRGEKIKDRSGRLEGRLEGGKERMRPASNKPAPKYQQQQNGEGFGPANKVNYPSLAVRRRVAGKYDALGI